MQRRLAEYDVVKWMNDFLDVLGSAKEEQQKQKVNVLDAEIIRQMQEDFSAAAKRCILLDYDGTLAPYQKFPSLASPSGELLQLAHSFYRRMSKMKS